jgi:hypothetical protein
MRIAPGTRYQVVVSYREPGYEERVGPRATPYRWTYAVVAENEEEARATALREFREVSRLSSVGWWREVVGVEVREPPAERGEGGQDRGRTAAECEPVCGRARWRG